MPIQFPLPLMGNPFDRWQWQWQRGAKYPLVQVNPNLARVGTPFSKNAMDPGFGQGVRVPVNVRNPGKFYQHGENSGSKLNPSLGVANAPYRVGDGVVIGTVARYTGAVNYSLSGVSRDKDGAAIAGVRVLAFRTADNSFVGETTTDGSGVWTMPVMRGGPFFLVEYLAGSPDKFGTSPNTLVPVQV